jgi:CRP-like cAMP-binding protein
MPQDRTAAGKPVRNTLLLQIPDHEFRAIKPHLEQVQFSNADRLESEGSRIDAVYFLNGGIGSMIIETSEGRSVEVGLSGREDMIGLPLAAGLDEFTFTVVIRVPGDGFRVQGDVMKQLLPQLPELRYLLLRRLAIRSVALAQNAACNRLHIVKQRLARWLLLTHDRLDSNLIRTTHDFLSRMVGTDRPSVTLALAELEREGIIQPSRGSIVIEDRRKLELRSCECYNLFRRFNPELGLSK